MLLLCYFKETARQGIDKRYVVSWRRIDHDSDDEQKVDNRDDMFDSKQMTDKKKVQETDSDRQKQTWTGIGREIDRDPRETSQYYFVLQSLHKVLPSTTSYYSLHKVPSQYYFVLQSLHKVLPSTTSYYKGLHKVLPSTTSYYKACTQHVVVLLRTTKLARSTL